MQALIDALEEAIRAHEETVAKRLEVEDQIKSLEVVAGGSGVKAMKARVELDAIRARSQTGQNMAEVRASMMTRKAKKALDEGDPMAEEMKRVEAAKKAKEAEEAAARAESKRRLAEKAAFLNK